MKKSRVRRKSRKRSVVKKSKAYKSRRKSRSKRSRKRSNSTSKRSRKSTTKRSRKRSKSSRKHKMNEDDQQDPFWNIGNIPVMQPLDGQQLPRLPPMPPQQRLMRPQIPNRMSEFINLCKDCGIEPFPRNVLYRQIAGDGPNHHDGICVRDVNPEALRQLLTILSENYENMVRDVDRKISKIDLIEILEYLASQLAHLNMNEMINGLIQTIRNSFRMAKSAQSSSVQTSRAQRPSQNITRISSGDSTMVPYDPNRPAGPGEGGM